MASKLDRLRGPQLSSLVNAVKGKDVVEDGGDAEALAARRLAKAEKKRMRAEAKGAGGSKAEPAAAEPAAAPPAAAAPAPPTKKKAKRRRKVKAAAPTARPDTVADKPGSVGNVSALKYLETWASNRATWKFNKKDQVHLLRFLYQEDMVPDASFTTLLGYLEGLEGSARSSTLADAVVLLDVYAPKPGETEADYSRAAPQTSAVLPVPVRAFVLGRAKAVAELLA